MNPYQMVNEIADRTMAAARKEHSGIVEGSAHGYARQSGVFMGLLSTAIAYMDEATREQFVNQYLKPKLS